MTSKGPEGKDGGPVMKADAVGMVKRDGELNRR